jgi:methylphosphotriester-DNA--protein-cysteine methyltransferase
MNEKGRGWQPETKLQEVFLETYTSKKRACEQMGVSQFTLTRLFKREEKFTYLQLNRLSKDSKVKIGDLIKLI